MDADLQLYLDMPCTVPTTEPNRIMFNKNKQFFLLPWNAVVTGLPEAAVFLASKKCNIVRAEAGAPAKRIHDCSIIEREDSDDLGCNK